jgi:hypothetical protein
MSAIVPPTRVAPMLPAAPMRNRLIRRVAVFFALLLVGFTGHTQWIEHVGFGRN